MAYRQPGVTVTEEFAFALPALAAFSLPNVIVGPVFTVLANQSGGAGSYSGGPATIPYPNKPLGSYVDTRPLDANDLISYPVVINLKDPIVQLKTSSAGAVNSPNFTTFTDATVGAFADINPGDIIFIATGTNAGTYTVRFVTDDNNLQINETFAAAGTGISYVIERNIQSSFPAGSYLNIPTSTPGVAVNAVNVQLPAGLTTTVAPFGSVPIESAEVLISYRAQRIEKSNDVYEYANTQALEADFGADQIVPESPAVFGAFLALSNSVTPTNLIALNSNYLSNELLAYDDAFTTLALNDVYAISVMTQSTSVHGALKSHVDGLSQPDKKLERVGIINRQLVTTQVVDGPFSNGTTDVTGFLLDEAGATFLTDGVVPGDFVTITLPAPNAGNYTIAAVNSQTELQLATAPGISLTGVHFTVNQNLTKPEQASVIAAYAHSFADSRLVLTWPDIVKIPVGNAIRQLPGYFLNCAVGALTTGLPTQQGLTNLSVAVYSGVVHSTKYFSNDDLNTIAGGGVMVFVQDILDQTPLFVRHQLTTDTSSVLFQEYSVTKNVDFVAKFIRINHAQFIGQYNIVPQTFDDLKTNAKGIINFLVEGTKRPKIGGVLVSATLANVSQNESELDGIVETWDITVPIPLNYLDITLVIS